MASNDEDSNDGTKPKISMRFNEQDKSSDVYVQFPDDSRPTKVPRTTEEIEKFFPYQPSKPRAPEPLPLDLFNKAVEDPGSVTEKDRLDILDWVPEAEADERCRNACGMTWHELITTAVEKPEDLTSGDVSFIEVGRYTTYKIRGAEHKRDFLMLMRHPENVRNLWFAAEKAVTDPRYAIAKNNALKQQWRIDHERDEALSHLTDDDRDNIQTSTYIPWVAQLTASPKPHFGLVCFRTAYDNDEAWKKYKEHILRSSRLGFLACQGTERVSKKWKIDFIDKDRERLNGASLEDMCRYFNDPLSSSITSSISAGLRSDAFLFADASTISYLNHPASDPSTIGYTPPPGAPPYSTEHLIPGYVNAVDASYDSAKTYAHDFKGILKVHPAHLATTFYHRLITRGQEKEQGSEHWWRYKQDWETMYMRAHGRFGRKGGIYPPLWTDNR